ncbi:MAG: hypothetical protein U9N14_01785, partial [Pseudomonadota bacterium]|nr:hypothetical protein [Pseudomonadota bacterium]
MKAARIQAGLTIALGFLIFAPSPMYYGAFALRWIALAILLLISLGPVFAHLKKTGAIRLDTLDLLGLAVCAWLALTVLWSTDTGAGIDALIHLALLVPFFWLIRYGPWPHDAHIPACVLAAAAIIVMGFDLVSPIHNGGYGNENFLTEFLIGAGAFIAVAGLALRHRGLLVVAALILADLIFVNPSKMEFPVLAVASVAVIFYLLPVRRTVKIGLLLALAVLAAGVVIVLAEPLLAHRSVYFRLPLQVSALLMWVDAPLFGHGLSSFNATFMQAPEAFRAVPFLADVPFNVQ